MSTESNGDPAPPAVRYRVYADDGAGGPIDYGSPVAEVDGLSWTSEPLAAGRFRFAVRAFDPATGMEEQNLDASARLTIDAEGRDATGAPPAPVGLRAVPLAGGRARIEWAVAGSPASRAATHFNVYLAPDAVEDFSAPAAVAPASSARGDAFGAEVSGLAHGVRHAVVVRAANASGEESNTRAVFFTPDSAPPDRVDAATATLTATVA